MNDASTSRILRACIAALAVVMFREAKHGAAQQSAVVA
jgi:hypothetical protein